MVGRSSIPTRIPGYIWEEGIYTHQDTRVHRERYTIPTRIPGYIGRYTCYTPGT